MHVCVRICMHVGITSVRTYVHNVSKQTHSWKHKHIRKTRSVFTQLKSDLYTVQKRSLETLHPACDLKLLLGANQ